MDNKTDLINQIETLEEELAEELELVDSEKYVEALNTHNSHIHNIMSIEEQSAGNKFYENCLDKNYCQGIKQWL